MDRFIARENVKFLNAQLKDCADEHKREMLERLLAEAEYCMAKLEHRCVPRTLPRH